MKIYVDGNVVRKLEDIPERFYPYVRKKLETYNSVLIAANVGGPVPVLRLYSTPGTSTETVPGGYSFVEIQGWGPGAGGGVFNPGTLGGGGGGGGGYTTVTLNIAANAGKTFIVVVGTGTATTTLGQGAVFSGTTQISAGSVTGFSTITLNKALSGQNQNGGTGGTAINGNAGATNQNGNNGTSAVSGVGASGGAGIAGDVAGDGSPYGTGGRGGGATAQGGQDGGAAFYYTT